MIFLFLLIFAAIFTAIFTAWARSYVQKRVIVDMNGSQEDLLALGYLIHSKDVQVIGVMTESDEVSAFLKKMRRADIRVIRGEHGSQLIDREGIHILCLRNLTHIAPLVNQKEQIREILITGGTLADGKATEKDKLTEDVSATSAVFKSGVPLSIIPNATSNSLKVKDTFVKQLIQKGEKELFASVEGVLTLCPTFAAAVLADPSYGKRRKKIAVMFDKDKGVLLPCTEGDKYKLHIEADALRFERDLLSTLNKRRKVA